MQLNFTVLLAALGASTNAATIPSSMEPREVTESINGTNTKIAAAAAGGTFIISEFDNRGCSVARNDWNLKDGKCYTPGSSTQSINLIWRSGNCKLGLYRRNCGDDSHIAMWDVPANTCIDLVDMNVAHYQLYC
ncbi:hypothetical protein V8F06_001505 [Rhypophila decipiens]